MRPRDHAIDTASLPFPTVTSLALLDQVLLDEALLPVKKLSGVDPVASVDLSSKKLGVVSAKVMAVLLGGNRRHKNLSTPFPNIPHCPFHSGRKNFLSSPSGCIVPLMQLA